ncbi:MAG: SUMF1/EgtB/PvdO family nonheme iron enzyme [Cetobacterium sp.]
MAVLERVDISGGKERKMKTNLKKYLRARRPIIWCNTNNYDEIDSLVTEITTEYTNKVIYEFRALGAIDFETKEISEEVKRLYDFLETIYSDGFEKQVFLILKNVDEDIKNVETLAYLKRIAELNYKNYNYNFFTIIVTNSLEIPLEIEDYTSILEERKLDEEEISSYIFEFCKKNEIKFDMNEIKDISILLKGLKTLEINHVLNMMLEEDRILSIRNKHIIIKEKGQLIKKSNILELVNFKEKIEDIGGLQHLKKWLNNKSIIFKNLEGAKNFGVDTPKGVLLVGMPGCGKSLAAKASARLFNTPLLRLDIGRLLGKYVGESEHNMREALKTAESISPCILWIDEIEKAFSGIEQSGGASDITKRLFGHFLTWLQEKESAVFVVATANDISSFPPEFLRKGRFDEIFFIDFPNEQERERIFEIHLEKRRKNLKNFDCLKLAKETSGYCGADIEEVIKLSIEEAFIKNKELVIDNLLKNIKEIEPLSLTLKDKIKVMRENIEKFRLKDASKSIQDDIDEIIKDNKNIDKDIEFLKNKELVLVKGENYKAANSYYNKNRVNYDLKVGKYQVTQNIWQKIMKNNPSKFLGSEKPVDSVSWWEALEFCNKLSIACGLDPVYKIVIREERKFLNIIQLDGKIVSPENVNFKKTEGFRLPTELEWEWFASGGEINLQNDTNYSFSGSDVLQKVGWFKENSLNETKRVGLKHSNQIGIYDCSGNVWEWCFDSFSEDKLPLNKTYIYNGSENRNRLRGGSWDSLSLDCRISSRGKLSKTVKSSRIGFRVVRTV